MRILVLVAFFVSCSNVFAEEFDKAKFEKLCEPLLTGNGACAKVEAGKGKRRACIKENIDKASKECKVYLESVK